MRNPLSDKVVGIQPSGIRKFFDIVSEMKDAISLGVGEPDFDTPWSIREDVYKRQDIITGTTMDTSSRTARMDIITDTTTAISRMDIITDIHSTITIMLRLTIMTEHQSVHLYAVL